MKLKLKYENNKIKKMIVFGISIGFSKRFVGFHINIWDRDILLGIVK